MSRTTLRLDSELLATAVTLSGHRTKKALIHEALQLLVAHSECERERLREIEERRRLAAQASTEESEDSDL